MHETAADIVAGVDSPVAESRVVVVADPPGVVRPASAGARSPMTGLVDDTSQALRDVNDALVRQRDRLVFLLEASSTLTMSSAKPSS